MSSSQSFNHKKAGCVGILLEVILVEVIDKSNFMSSIGNGALGL